jgi:hypothetical protein
MTPKEEIAIATAKLHRILETAIDLARAFDDYDNVANRNAIPDGSEVQALVGVQLLTTLRESARYLLSVYPTMRQQLEDVICNAEDSE